MKNIAVNYNSNKPMYQQLYDQISSQIISKTLLPDTQLPSIRKTAKELRVSIITIKKTWEMLEYNNFVYTVAGKGVFVSDNTDSNLEHKKSELIEEQLSELIIRTKELDLSKDELIDLINKLY